MRAILKLDLEQSLGVDFTKDALEIKTSHELLLDVDVSTEKFQQLVGGFASDNLDDFVVRAFEKFGQDVTNSVKALREKVEAEAEKKKKKKKPADKAPPAPEAKPEPEADKKSTESGKTQEGQ